MLLLSLFEKLMIFEMIIFLRHGQAENNTQRILAGRSSGIQLTETGITQAENIGKFLQSFNISHIYSSPIERAKHTAQIVAKHNSVDYSIDKRLIELEMGKFTKMPYDDLFTKYGNVFLKFYENSPEISENRVETFSQVQKRVLDIVDFVSKKHKGENVVLVTHMDPIKAMISTILKLNAKSLFELIIANASLTIIKGHDSKFYITAINSMNPDRYHHSF